MLSLLGGFGIGVVWAWLGVLRLGTSGADWRYGTVIVGAAGLVGLEVAVVDSGAAIVAFALGLTAGAVAARAWLAWLRTLPAVRDVRGRA